MMFLASLAIIAAIVVCAAIVIVAFAFTYLFIESFMRRQNRRKKYRR